MKITFTRIIKYLIHRYRNNAEKQKFKTLPLGFKGKNIIFRFPSVIAAPKLVFLHDYTMLHSHHIIYNYTGKFIMKEYSTASIDLLVVTGNHVPTVGIPQSLLSLSHINDKETDIIIEEDAWIGARVTLLAGAHIGRGAVIGANSLVNKEVPPYAVAVGSPARIIASKFTIEQIIEHEKVLYPQNKRFSKEYLEQLFETYYQNKKHIGVTSNLEDIGLPVIMERYKFKYINNEEI